MPKIAANLTMLFTEVPFLERFAAARNAGFRYVEFLHPYEYSPEQLQELVESNGLQVVLFNLPSGDWAAGERGIAANPGRVEEFRAGVKRAITYAQALGVHRLNCLAGKASPDFSPAEHWHTLAENLSFAADALGEAGLSLVVEPINHYDIPGFVLNTTRQGLDLIAQAGRSNLYLQYDIYHAQREEGNITPTLREHISKIAHI
ncbi:MAG: hydroxypyruvate isomerase family protein, partial [Bacillota bacterium]